MPVHGVAIPTIQGIRNVLDLIGALKNGKERRVLWHNLREEPVSTLYNVCGIAFEMTRELIKYLREESIMKHNGILSACF